MSNRREYLMLLEQIRLLADRLDKVEAELKKKPKKVVKKCQPKS